MSGMECWLLGSRIRVSTTELQDADVILGWRMAEGYMPVLLAKKRFKLTYAAGWSVRSAKETDAALIRGMYGMTCGKAVMLPVREGLWTASGAEILTDPSGKDCAYCTGSVANGVWVIHEWGQLPDTDTAKAASAAAASHGCLNWQMRAELAPEGGELAVGECLYLKVPKPFLLGTEKIEDVQQLVLKIEEALG